MRLSLLFGILDSLNRFLGGKGCENHFFKVLAYILLSLGICTFILAGIDAIGKKQMISAEFIIGHVLLFLVVCFIYACCGKHKIFSCKPF